MATYVIMNGITRADDTALENELRTTLGALVAIYARTNGTVIVNFSRDSTMQEYLDCRAIIGNHYQAKAAAFAAEIDDVNARFLLSEVASKTPAQIYTTMQNAIDGWTSLADAQRDLRKWLPLMAALMAVKLQKREGNAP